MDRTQSINEGTVCSYTQKMSLAQSLIIMIDSEEEESQFPGKCPLLIYQEIERMVACFKAYT